MKHHLGTIAATLFLALAIPALALCPQACAAEVKRTLKNNMTEVYHVLPGTAEHAAEIFTKGVFYGRLRTNYFTFHWDELTIHDPTGFGLGGSLIYKTAPLHGVSATAGFYTSQNLGFLERADALFGKSGKDTFSRHDRIKDHDWGMSLFAQAYLEYCLSRTTIKAGRQIFESFLTKSNDTKFIPNTFQGLTVVSRDIPKTTITLGYFTKQKLRDHTQFHDVITFGDGKGFLYSRWSNNDDSAAHKGLSHENLTSAGEGVDNKLLVAGISNNSLKSLQVHMWYTGVPDLFCSLMWESHYEISLLCGWTLTPGVRYMRQFDHGAGRVGGAALTGALAGQSGSAKGYRDADSVDGSLYAARLVLNKGAGKLLLGFSKVSDDADLIAPWRGFPTGGYTRAMAQYNWEANTRSYMAQAFYDFGKAGILNGFRARIDYTYIDYDDRKERLGGIRKTDRSYIHMDMWYALPFLPGLEAKLRAGVADADKTSLGLDPSHKEFRFELNYLL